MYFIFPPHVTCASALPGETEKPKIASFHINAAHFLLKTTRNTLKYIWLQLNHLSLSKRSTECTRQDLRSSCLLPTRSMLTKNVMVSVTIINVKEKKQIENLLEFLRRREMTAIMNHSVKHFWLQIIKEFLRHIFSSTMYVTTNFSIQLFNCIFSYSNFNYNCTYYVVCVALCMYYL